MKIHPQLQVLVDIKDHLKRDKAIGYLGFSDGCVPDIPQVMDEGGFPKYEIWDFGSSIISHEAFSIIDELQVYIEKLERDHAQTISDLMESNE